MKFWLPLIVGTIAVSGFLTYLNLFKGAQTITFPPPAPQAAPGKLEFGQPVPITARVELIANVVELDGGVSYVGETASVGINLENTGDGPLELSLLNKGTCDCANFYLDDKEITQTDHTVTIPPHKSGVFRITWRPTVRHVSEKFRNRASFEHNDPRYNDNIQFELVSNVKARR